MSAASRGASKNRFSPPPARSSWETLHRSHPALPAPCPALALPRAAYGSAWGTQGGFAGRWLLGDALREGSSCNQEMLFPRDQLCSRASGEAERNGRKAAAAASSSL